MNIKIYQIGGNNPEGYLGTATDTQTGRSLLSLAQEFGATGVSLHGTSPGRFGALSGEYTLAQAMEEMDRTDPNWKPK